MGFIQRTRAWFRKDKLAQDHADELQFHLDMHAQQNIDQGMPPVEARRKASIRFGNPTTLRERLRQIDLFTLPETIAQDLRFGIRMLVKHPSFTLMAVLALGLGIGVNTATFTIYKAAVLRQVEGQDPNRIVNLTFLSQSGDMDPMFSYADYQAYRDHAHSLSGLIASTGDQIALSGVDTTVGKQGSLSRSLASSMGFLMAGAMPGGTEFASATIVSENYFSILGINAIQGRVFQPGDEQTLAAAPAVLISENFWQRRFGGDPAVIGKSIKLNNVAFTIVGITPHDFVGAENNLPNFWVPMSLLPLLRPGTNLADPDHHCCRVWGRLAPHSTMADAQSELNVLAGQQRGLHAPGSVGSKPSNMQVSRGSPFPQALDRDSMFAFILIMIAVGLVLVIACTNVASLQLARAAARQNELNMRLSLGASRLRLIRQLLTESALLSVLAGSIALLFTWGFLHIAMVELASALPPDIAITLNVAPDMRIFAYVLAVSLVAGVLFGLAPALESSKAALAASLKAGGGSSPFRNKRLRNLMITAQVAICLVLMIAGSLLIRSSMNSLNLSTGYETAHVILTDISFPAGSGYDRARQVATLNQLASRIRSLPGAASVSIGRPPDGGGLRTVNASVSGEKSSGSSKQQLFFTYVQPNFFETLSVPMLSGRPFAEQNEASNSIVISDSTAKRLWPGQNAVGHKLTLDITGQYHPAGELTPTTTPYEVIGVVADTRGVMLDNSDIRKVYLTLPLDRLEDRPILIRSQGDPTSLIPAVARLIHSTDPNLVTYAVTLNQMLHMTPQFIVSRCAAIFASIVGLLGLLLASVGIYGTVSYIVVLRTREVGIRMALGAKKSDVLTLMLRESTRPVVWGLLCGVLLASGVSHLFQGILYGIGPADPISFLGVSALFLGIATVAAYMPSRKATRIDPMISLRYE